MLREQPVAFRLLPLLLVLLVAMAGCTYGSQPPAVAGADEDQPPEQTSPPQPAETGTAEPPLEGAVPADLDGDGQDELIHGLSDTWTYDPVEIYTADGQLLFVWGDNARWYETEHKVSVHRLPGQDRAVILYWHRRAGGQPEVGLTAFRSEQGELLGSLFYGWGLKHANATPATRASVTDDGYLLVEWDMGDPARHTRVRKYAVDVKRRMVEIVDEAYVPEGDELVYPTDPEEVLRAAHLAAVYGLDEELPRYFSSTDVARAFQAALPEAEMPDGRLDWTRVELATVHALDQYCRPEAEPAETDASGAAPFVVSVAGEGHGVAIVGTLWFDTDESGRTIIRDFSVLRHCPADPNP
ncbi:hypothetical protein J2Z79_000001 [Symbiobacterium terraclitae]|uniref:Uncharacterized protein n=1 Tax=Symbiobacterium terraclitae TaxID=557451 RepID=A0ABS4JM62_9FIRM|nr:hypothetical protein [Symbiobacterium terraclitae]MBP2016628.1 hypothetical protein [Symbiobacterium terraclitae]